MFLGFALYAPMYDRSTRCDILIYGVDLFQGFDSCDSDFSVGIGPI